jgi:hypothetical protein
MFSHEALVGVDAIFPSQSIRKVVGSESIPPYCSETIMTA